MIADLRLNHWGVVLVLVEPNTSKTGLEFEDTKFLSVVPEVILEKI